MSPYRSTPASSRAHELRLAEPLPTRELFGVGVLFATPFLAAFATESVFGMCVVTGFAVLVASLVLLCRHRAWLVMMPREERLRVVRLRAWSYSASTLRLSEAMTVECSPVGNTMWLFVVAKDGRAARVIPAASTRTIERVRAAIEEALKSSDTRPGTPSPR